MPHIIIKMLPGRTSEKKQAIADAVAKAVVDTAGCPISAVSVAIEDIDNAEWDEKVYDPDIAARPDLVFIQPGYPRGA